MTRHFTVSMSPFVAGGLTVLLLAGCPGPTDSRHTVPSVLSTSPAAAATDIPVASSFMVVFTTDMDPASITAGTFVMSGGVEGTLNCVHAVVTFTPVTPLAYHTTYTVTITTGARSVDGTPLASAYTWTFTTAAAVPFVQSTSPANGATGVQVNPSEFSVTFSTDMDAATITANTFLVSGLTGSVRYAAQLAYFTPASSLAYSTTYTATITTGARSNDGVPLASDYTWSFTTVPIPVGALRLDSVPALWVGEGAALRVQATDTYGYSFNLPPGVLHFTVVQGGDKLQLAGDSVRALAEGDAVITAQVAQVVSPPLTIRVLRRRYRVTDLGADLGTNSNTAPAVFINGVGQVAGTATLAGGVQHAFLWTPDLPNGRTGNLTDLGTPPHYVTTVAADINDAGQVVGSASATTRAFVWQNGVFQIIVGPSSWSGAVGINSAGQVLLMSGAPYIWDHGTLTPVFSGMSPTAWAAAGINDSGTAVGSMTFGPGVGIQQAWIYQAGSARTDGNWVPVAINNRGQIIGHGVAANGLPTRSFLLDPVAARPSSSASSSRTTSGGSGSTTRARWWESPAGAAFCGRAAGRTISPRR